MSRIVKILILVSIIAILLIAFFIWRDYRTIERKYQACIEICQKSAGATIASDYLPGSGRLASFEICELKCKEEYGK
jgi:hypothetical protein